MNINQKRFIFRLSISLLFMLFGIFIFKNFVSFNILYFMFFFASYILAGYDIIFKSFKHILKFKFLDDNFLMFIATIGALFLNQFVEAILIFLLYQIGEFFQNIALLKSKKNISSTFSIRPSFVNLKVYDSIKKVDPVTVLVGDVIIIKPGEIVPLDGIVLKGNSYLDCSCVNGESSLLAVSKGDRIFSGVLNVDGTLELKVEKKYENSTVKKILDLIDNVEEKKSKTEQLVRKFAKIYTPIVVFLAFLIFFIPFVFFGCFWKMCLKKSLIFLVMSCPCALVISVPVSFFLAINKAAKNGILFKGSIFLEILSKVKILIFDKTGTLTRGSLTVSKISSNVFSNEKLLEIVALAESKINHPIAKSIVKAYAKEVNLNRIVDVKEVFGKGVKALIDGQEVLVGNSKFMEEAGFNTFFEDEIGTYIHVIFKGEYVGFVVLKDEIKLDAVNVVLNLKNNGVKKVIMLTGDKKNVGEFVAKKLSIDAAFCELLPFEKVNMIEQLKKEEKEEKIAFVGDGVNDAASLKMADVGFVMGNLGADAAVEAADVVLMDDDVEKVNFSIKISKKVMKTIKQNIVFSLLCKGIIFVFGVFGFFDAGFAVFSDALVSFLAIFNAFKAFKD